MGKTITAKPNQSMSDIIIQALGSLEAGIAFCTLNKVAISDMPVVGTSYEIPDTAAAQLQSDNNVLKYFVQNEIVIGTLGNEPPVPPPPPALGMTVILKPVMAVNYMGIIAPGVLGYYPIELNSAAGFINMNPIASVYPGDNKMNHEDTGGMYIGTPPGVTLELGGLPMPAKHVEYRVPWPGPLGDIWVWNPYLGLRTVTFEDIAGNRACAAPVIVLYDNTAGINEYLIAGLQVDFVSSDGYTATLRLTRSHAPTVHINLIPPYGNITMYWTPVTSVLYSDPAHPGDPDVCLIDLPPGLHTLGVETTYTNNILPFTWPARSTCTQVIEVL